MKITQDAKIKCSFKLGGKVKKLIIIEKKEELLKLDEDVLKKAEVIGDGTNILVSDKGAETVIQVALKGPKIEQDRVTVNAGVNLSRLAVSLVREGYREFKFAIGIPGSIGGAVVMNSGTDSSISDVLESVTVMTRSKEIKVLKAQELKYGYRNSVLQDKDWIVLSAVFRAKKGKPVSREEIVSIFKQRARIQPLCFPSAGCCFKGSWGGNDIIREIGMAGQWKGGAVSSPLFPSFILNVNATSQDVYGLIKEIQNKAKVIGKELPLEIKLIGQFDG